jgi:hypothetical protein
MRKTAGDELSLFGNAGDTLLPADAALMTSSPSKLTADVFASSLFGQTSNVAQGGAGPILATEGAAITAPATSLVTAASAGASVGMAPDAVSLSSAASESGDAAVVMSAVTTGALSKLDSQLAALYLSQSSMAAGATAFTSMVQQFAGSISESGQYVVIDAAAADGNGSGLLADLQQIGLIGGASFGAMASGWLPIDRIGTLAGLSDLNFARESIMTTNVGSVTTQADHALTTDAARSTYGVDGSGIKVGILSDSFNFLGGYNADIASGDLPAGVQILQDSGSTDEGRAMAQLIHDIAPGASLAFATANGGQAGFASNIIALKNAGAKVIVDDVSYFAEPMFQDGVIAQAVDQVAAAGVVYFSAAANNGHKGYEAAYLSSGTTQTIGGRPETLHNFNSASPTTFMPFTLTANRTATVVLEWNQPAASVSPGHGATSDLDLFVYNAAGSVVSISQASNIGRDPIEVVQFSNFSSATQTYQIAVGLTSGAAPSDLKIVTFNGNGTVSNGFASNTNDGTVYGHAAAASAIAVGAASYAQTPGFGVNPALIESFSSAGPTRILFDTAGNPISVVRQTPQITAPDGGNTSFFGADDGDADSFPNFYGTSAAAPAAAAVAALLLQENGSLTPAAIKNVLMNSAIDMDNPATPGFDTGFDVGTGAGLIQAGAALAMVSTPSISINDVTIAEGNSGTKVATFTVTRSGGTPAFDVSFATADGSATVADADYVAAAGTLHFAVGVNTQTISVTINGDTKLEPDETFSVNLSGATNGAIISDGQGIGTIADDEPVVLTGTAGNDNLAGGLGDDTLIGGADIITPALGNLPGQTGRMGSEWHVVSSQDFSGDGKGDILWVRGTTGDAALWTMNNGSLAAFYSATQGHMGPEWTAVGSGDFNRDGKADLVWTRAGNIAIWQMDGPNLTAFATPAGHMGPEWHMKLIGDFNGDGYSDLLWHSDSGAIADWSMNGTALGGFGISNGAIGKEWTASAAGDFNGDGRDDILWLRNNGDVQIWTMNGSNYTGITNTGHMGTDWHVAGSGDFNMDGKTDLVWVSDNNDVQIWEMNGGNIAQIITPSGHMGTEWKLQGVNDFNGDARPDLLWVSTIGTTAVWNMTGTGDFMTGGGGSDTFQFNALNETGKVITDFAPGAGGDILDLHTLELATGYTGNDGLRDGSVRLIQNGANTEVQVDSHFGEHHWVDAATLQNVNAAALIHANFLV